jgi:branched-chain amino acid transport system ATP-binding protein
VAEPHLLETPASTGFLSGHALELQAVSRHFGALKAIDAVSFNVSAGERYAVLGSNGAGKTTLFNAITGDFPPTSGRVLLFGEDVTALPAHERIRRGLRRTYQSSLLFRDLSVRDNLYLAVRGVSPGRFGLRRAGRTDASVAAANELLVHTRLGHLADTPVRALAHGQQRHADLELVSLLNALPRHIGFVIIEHDLEIALRVVERVTVMHNGCVLKHGTPDEIQNDAQVQAIYMGEGHHGH